MPRYDVRCRACGTTFEVQRPIAEADRPAPCPQGHDDTVRLLSTISLTGKASGGGSAMPAGGGGGCCGGACGCG